MGTLSLFLWKSIVVSGCLTTWYMLGLRGRRLHQYNRFFLLSTLFASLTIPFFHFQLFSIHHIVTGNLTPVSLFGNAASDTGGNLPSIQQAVKLHIDWPVIAATIAAIVSLTLLLILSVRILRVKRMCREYPATQLDGVKLLLTDSPRAPFAFLQYLFWNKTIPLDGEIGQLILRHELAHIEHGHTYDKLACQVLTCIFWFNPFYWIIGKELNIVHEFIADEHAVSNRDTETFAMMLLQSYNNGSYLVPEHNFFSSTVKRRLAMLQNAAKPSYAMLRRFMIAPLLVGTVLLFSFSIRNGLAGHIEPAKKKIVVMLDAGHGGQDAGAGTGRYTEKELCLRCAQRIKELAPAYNIEVKLTRANDKDIPLAQRVIIANKATPDVFISLHVGDEQGREKAKGDYDIYVAGKNANARQSNNYSTAIFRSMAESGIIPGTGGCVHDPLKPCANCSRAAAQLATQTAGNAKMQSTEKEELYVLTHASMPAMVMILGNINDKDGMQQLTDDDRLDVLGNAVLKGIVDGATAQDGINQGGPPCSSPCAPEDKRPAVLQGLGQ